MSCPSCLNYFLLQKQGFAFLFRLICRLHDLHHLYCFYHLNTKISRLDLMGRQTNVGKEWLEREVDVTNFCLHRSPPFVSSFFQTRET